MRWTKHIPRVPPLSRGPQRERLRGQGDVESEREFMEIGWSLEAFCLARVNSVISSGKGIQHMVLSAWSIRTLHMLALKMR